MLAHVVGLVPEILSQSRALSDNPGSPDWIVRGAQWSRTGAAVVRLGPETGAAAAVLKASFSPEGQRGLRVQMEALARLEAEARLGAWRRLLPRTMAEGEIGGLYFTLQEALPGIPAETSLAEGGLLPRLLLLAAEAIRPLHEHTAEATVDGEALVDQAVDRPIALIRKAARSALPVRREETLARLAQDLRCTMKETTPRTSWVHGDYWLGNVLVTRDGSRLTGIIDWTMAATHELALHDAFHLVLHGRQLAQHCELGDVVVAALKGAAWQPYEQAVLATLRPSPLGNADWQRASVLLYWLGRLSRIFVQGGGHMRNQVWVAWNIDRVLRCL
ncbi:MAG: phosphotransferase family protein [Chloroflexota bacterium]